MKRPCLEAGCDRLTPRTRCEEHERARERARSLRRGTTSERGYGSAWQSLRLRILARDGYRCAWCGRPANTVDHVMPKALGGTDDEANLASSCGQCNSVRGGMTRRTPR